MNFTIFNSSNGKIFCSGQAPDLSIQKIPDGHNLIAEKSDPEKDYVIDRVVVHLPEKPNEFCEFNYETKQWVENINLLNTVTKQKRNLLLKQSDWTQLPDVPLETKQAWAAYRQGLRDITAQEGYPFTVIWTTPPAA